MRMPGVMAAASLCIGCAGVYLLMNDGMPLAILAHLAASVVGCYAAILSDSRRLGGHWFQASVSFSIPFLGGCTAYFLSEAVKRKKSGTLSDEFAIYLNDAASFRESIPVADTDPAPAESILPLADVLANPISEAEQRIAVENLASMETPDAMGILRRVIDSDSGEGRFFAMTALGQMEEKLLAKMQRQENELSSGREVTPGMMVAAARTYLDFSYFQIAQNGRRLEYLTRPAELLTDALAMNDCDGEAMILMGRVGLMLYKPEEALEMFNAYLKIYPESQNALLWRAETWYMLGDYQKVRDDCLHAREVGDVPGWIGDAVEFWTAGSETAIQSGDVLTAQA